MNDLKEPHGGDEEEEPIRRIPVQARQGGRSHSNLRVLVFSLGAVVLILAAIYLLFFPIW